MILPDLTSIDEHDLPQPLRLMLTQPLLTIAIADYYGRTPKLRKPLSFTEDAFEQRLSRAIVMIIDQNQMRDDALIADKFNESRVVELALIDIDLKQLPKNVIEDVRAGEIPFGQLLVKHNIATHHIHLQYFKLIGDEDLAMIFNCKIGQELYGRKRTLVREDNQAHIAHVVEILNALS